MIAETVRIKLLKLYLLLSNILYPYEIYERMLCLSGLNPSGVVVKFSTILKQKLRAKLIQYPEDFRILFKDDTLNNHSELLSKVIGNERFSTGLLSDYNPNWCSYIRGNKLCTSICQNGYPYCGGYFCKHKVEKWLTWCGIIKRIKYNY